MEVSMIGSSQAKLGRADLACRDVGFCDNLSRMILPRKSMISFGQTVAWPKSPSVRFTLKAESVVSDKVSGDKSLTTRRRSKSNDAVSLYVGLPLDSISDCNRITHERAISVGLKALKLLGVTGVELPIWWGIAEKESMGKYDWSAYLALAEMVQKVGLKLHVSLCFHASKELKIPLPQWVSEIGESQSNIFFEDRSGKQYKDCLSFAADDLPILNGKTPIQVYTEFCENFKSSFSPFMGSTITGISIGLGPNGELRYPSHDHHTKNQKVPGAGEFQCYDENTLNHLKGHAQAQGNPLWGLSGPHDVPSYDQSPNSTNFFKDHGGSWETPYGDFFLSWYSGLLLSHGDRVLSLASSTFGDTPVTVAGKLPLMHSWYKTQSHATELTAGFYNTAGRDGYEAVAEIFKRNSCKMILPGMDLIDEHQPNKAFSSPELLLAQITTACKKHKVDICGQNSSSSSSVSGAAPKGGFEQIKKYVLGENGVVDLFTYQRMGANLFSPEHFPSFTEFVRSVNQPKMHSDDLPSEDDEALTSSKSSKNLQMQAA